MLRMGAHPLGIFSKGIDGRGRWYSQRHRKLDHRRRRQDIPLRSVVELVEDERIDRLQEVRTQHGHAFVGRGGTQHINRDPSAGSGPVLHHDGAVERLVQLFRKRPCDDIECSARREAHQNPGGRLADRLRDGRRRAEGRGNDKCEAVAPGGTRPVQELLQGNSASSRRLLRRRHEATRGSRARSDS